uniref:Uncharacterized protein n=1 Tax=Glossina brevipalpis TaxID=37001 RepID=A0A1A9WEP2_9MUSC
MFFAAVVVVDDDDDDDVLLNEVVTNYKISEKIWLVINSALFPPLLIGNGTTPAVLGAKPTTAALLPALLTETAAVAAAGEKRGRLQIVVAVVVKAVLFLFVIVIVDELFVAVEDGDKKLSRSSLFPAAGNFSQSQSLPISHGIIKLREFFSLLKVFEI